MFCKFCGSQLPDGTKFCTRCGGQLSSPAANRTGQDTSAFSGTDNAAWTGGQNPPINTVPNTTGGSNTPRRLKRTGAAKKGLAIKIGVAVLAAVVIGGVGGTILASRLFSGDAEEVDPIPEEVTEVEEIAEEAEEEIAEEEILEPVSTGISCRVNITLTVESEELYTQLLSQMKITLSSDDGAVTEIPLSEAVDTEDGSIVLENLEEGSYVVALQRQEVVVSECTLTVAEGEYSTADLDYSFNPYSLYADVVAQYEETYGTVSFWEDRYSNTDYLGVFFLALVDFDQNGVDELVIGYAVDPGIDDIDYITWPYLDVWQISDLEAVIAYEGAIIDQSDIGKHCAYTLLDDTWYLLVGYNGSGIDLSLLALQDGEFVAVSTLEQNDDDYIPYIDGVEVSSDEFYTYLNTISQGCPYLYYQTYNYGGFCGTIYSDSSYTADDLTEQIVLIKSVIGLE